MILYEHYTDVPEDVWWWANFTPREIACKGTGELLLVSHAMDSLQTFRELVGKPIIINSAYRSALHNARIGGAPLSRHKKGDAFDVSLKGHDKAWLHEMAKKAGFTGFGLRYKSFIHIDKGRPRSW